MFYKEEFNRDIEKDIELFLNLKEIIEYGLIELERMKYKKEVWNRMIEEMYTSSPA